MRQNKPVRRPEVLIIDDEEDVRVMLSKMFLSRFGVEPAIAASVDEAEDLLKHCDFHLVVSDLQLPGRDGLEVMRILTAQEKFPPLLFFTAMDVPAFARNNYPCVAIGKKNYCELLTIASEFLDDFSI